MVCKKQLLCYLSNICSLTGYPIEKTFTLELTRGWTNSFEISWYDFIFHLSICDYSFFLWNITCRLKGMESQSLLCFHFIHNFQFQPAAQVCVSWRVYSGDYYKNELLSHHYVPFYHLTFCNVMNCFWFFREDEYLVNMQHTVIPSWYQREGYIKAMVNLIEKELKGFDCPEKVPLLFV